MTARRFLLVAARACICGGLVGLHVLHRCEAAMGVRWCAERAP